MRPKPHSIRGKFSRSGGAVDRILAAFCLLRIAVHIRPQGRLLMKIAKALG